jgi:glucose-6-phosphate 1-dehydrogenase
VPEPDRPAPAVRRPSQRNNRTDCNADPAGVLAFRIQPDEGISLSFSAKRLGMQFVLKPMQFNFDYGMGALPDGYERLALGCPAR